MSRQPEQSAEPSRFQQRKAAKAMMYATSNEAEVRELSTRRNRDAVRGGKYAPPDGQRWTGQAFGLASSKAEGRLDRSATRFHADGVRGEQYYGQRRGLNQEAGPAVPGSRFARGGGGPPRTSAAVEDVLRQVRELYLRNRKALAELPDDGARLDRMCELNVARQVINVANTTVVQEAWRREQPLSIHGWIYSIANGKLSDLDLGVNNNPELRTLEADSYNG